MGRFDDPSSEREWFYPSLSPAQADKQNLAGLAHDTHALRPVLQESAEHAFSIQVSFPRMLLHRMKLTISILNESWHCR